MTASAREDPVPRLQSRRHTFALDFERHPAANESLRCGGQCEAHEKGADNDACAFRSDLRCAGKRGLARAVERDFAVLCGPKHVMDLLDRREKGFAVVRIALRLVLRAELGGVPERGVEIRELLEMLRLEVIVPEDV